MSREEKGKQVLQNAAQSSLQDKGEGGRIFEASNSPASVSQSLTTSPILRASKESQGNLQQQELKHTLQPVLVTRAEIYKQSS